MTDNERLDRICLNEDDPLARARSAETLNTLHACRTGHPLGRDNSMKWRNAMFVINGRCRAEDWDWLQRKAREETDAVRQEKALTA
jgi:hypothetical protein